MHRQHLFTDFIPLLGIQDKLESGGITILDVGCGNGMHAALMAERYPNSKFVGIDLSEKAIEQAKMRRKESNGEAMPNLEFRIMDAGKMDPTWTNSFDVVLIFDSCHDQMRPDLCLKEVHRVLKPGCRFVMLEVKGTSSIYKDRQLLGARGCLGYSSSLLHCLPVASNSPDALGLGSAWGQVKAESMLKEAGFTKTDVVDIPSMPTNIVYISYK
ncbi:hypothetical protein WR25_26956 isoform D [Diploscapter pachys]|uniref:Methyltransferase domain-containing protein n=1 Tax=Diploscapter pachys TaxID=2018661 RepID=A0A2A2KZC3_9BILA|nr:hypothetical protein WR25_26956 isoform A [Diploscapter pachys]PAV79231.1 hypothetical protein WR25_26956 isoform B [Diploscapter pachys]PAV79232.1 hypothetical protein WR25_26956 isoform C [Diploscapter pachys]PAV79233.1 hypothetical protein WR25_26956 isoform D [Diploscapter pachys]